MSLATTLLLFGGFAVVLFWVVVWKVNRGTYRYPCAMIVPEGDGEAIRTDMFRLRQKDGRTEVKFLRHKGTSYSPPHNFWTRWIRKDKSVPNDGWEPLNDKQAKQAVTRGAIFQQVSDSEWAVAKIIPGGVKVLDYDSRQVVIDSIRKRKELTTSFKDKLIQMGTWLGSLLLIAALATLIIVLTFKYAGEQSAALVAAAKQVAAAQPGVGG